MAPQRETVSAKAGGRAQTPPCEAVTRCFSGPISLVSEKAKQVPDSPSPPVGSTTLGMSGDYTEPELPPLRCGSKEPHIRVSARSPTFRVSARSPVLECQQGAPALEVIRNQLGELGCHLLWVVMKPHPPYTHTHTLPCCLSRERESQLKQKIWKQGPQSQDTVTVSFLGHEGPRSAFSPFQCCLTFL